MSESHTSTCEWQQFELRMRRRRADHCLLQASAALDAEFPEAAEGALNEARQLCPGHPQLNEVAARLRSALDRSETDLQPRPLPWVVIIFTWVLGALALLG